MKAKGLLSVILVSCACLFLVACQETTTKKKTTGSSLSTTSNKTTSTKTTTSAKTTTKKDTTARKTTTAQTTTKEAVKQQINIYCWNNEFKQRVDVLHPEVYKSEGNTTILRDGTILNWVMIANNANNYRDALDIGLENNLVDIFCVEPDYIKAYTRSNYVATMSEFGLNQDYQYQYTKNLAKNTLGDYAATTWQITPGVIAYNVEVAKEVFGNDITLEDMKELLSVRIDDLDNVAETVKEKGKKMYIGQDELYRKYICNLRSTCYDGEKITIDRMAYEWIIKTKKYASNGYFYGVDRDYSIWNLEWGNEQANNNVLCVNTCPWYSDYVLPNYVTGDYEYTGDLGYRLVPECDGWYWGGTFLCASRKATQIEGVKNTVSSILKEMTTNKDLLKVLTLNFKDACNDTRAMEELATSDDGNSSLFGGQNVMAVYDEAAKNTYTKKISEYDYTIFYSLQSEFLGYFKGTDSLENAWANFLIRLKNDTGINDDSIYTPLNVRFIDNEIIIS